MKNIFKKSWTRFRALCIQEQIIWALVLLVGMVTALVIFFWGDRTPATSEDYTPLKEHAIAVENDPASLLYDDINIKICDGIINITFSNEECAITAQYDSNWNLIAIHERDYATNCGAVLFVSLLMGIFGAGMAVAILPFIVFPLGALIEKCKQAPKKANKNLKKK